MSNPSSRFSPAQVKGFAAAVKKARTLRGFTQRQLAAEAKISQQMIAHIERGENVPSLANYVSLCRALALTPPPFFKW